MNKSDCLNCEFRPANANDENKPCRNCMPPGTDAAKLEITEADLKDLRRRTIIRQAEAEADARAMKKTLAEIDISELVIRAVRFADDLDECPLKEPCYAYSTFLKTIQALSDKYYSHLEAEQKAAEKKARRRMRKEGL